MNKILDNLTILVNSCDAYNDLWDPFFKLFKKFGGDLTKCPIILNTESKQYSYDGLNINCPNNYTEPVEWGRRLRNTLKTIETDYVFFLLDDFFLQRLVDISVFKQCITWLDDNPKVGAFNFISIEEAVVEHSVFTNFCLMPSKLQYRVNAQACIWRKDFLYNSILDIESPWEWETYGNIRNSKIYSNVEIYAIKYGIKSPYDYNFINYKKSNKDKIIVESAVMRGKWDLKCIEKCFKENNIKIDYSIRGIYKKPQKNYLRRIASMLTRPFRMKKLREKIAISKAEQAKKYNLLVEKPVEEYLKKQAGKIND